VPREALGVDRRARDDELEVRAPREQLLEVAEQEVDVERALVGLVDDDRVVAAQLPVAGDLGEQQAVGHELDERVVARAVGEADGVADGLAERHAELLGDARGDGARGEPPRLRVGDRAGDAAAELEAELGQLRRLARARLPRHHDDLVVSDGREQVVAAGADRQLRRIADVELGQPGRARGRPVAAARRDGHRPDDR